MLTVLSLAAFPGLENLTLFDYVDFLLSLIALVGIFGFSYRKRIGTVVFWRYFFYAVLLETIVFIAVLPILGIPRYGTSDVGYSMMIFEIVYAVVFLWALYSYAYKDKLIWNRG